MVLHFQKSTKCGEKRPVAFLDGKLHVIDGKSPNAFKVKEGESWECDTVKTECSFVIINPVKIDKTEAENSAYVKATVIELKNELESKYGKSK